MIKKNLLALAILLIITNVSFGQKVDRENVKALVRQEIHNAIGLDNRQTNTDGSGVILFKLMIIVSAGAAAFGYVFYRRKKNVKEINDKILQNKIELIKKEKLVYRMDPRLKIIRNKLSETISPAALRLETIKENAKRLNISQEEILLAARLKLYTAEKNNHIKNNYGGSIA